MAFRVPNAGDWENISYEVATEGIIAQSIHSWYRQQNQRL